MAAGVHHEHARLHAVGIAAPTPGRSADQPPAPRCALERIGARPNASDRKHPEANRSIPACHCKNRAMFKADSRATAQVHPVKRKNRSRDDPRRESGKPIAHTRWHDFGALPQRPCTALEHAAATKSWRNGVFSGIQKCKDFAAASRFRPAPGAAHRPAISPGVGRRAGLSPIRRSGAKRRMNLFPSSSGMRQ